MRFKSLKTAAFLLAGFCVFGAAPSFAQDYESQELVDRARERKDGIEIEDLKTNDKLLEEARARVEAMKIPDVDLERAGDFFGEDFNEQVESYRGELPKDVLYVFVSFSMEDSLIKSYIQDVSRTGGIVVIGGLHNNSFKETVSKIEEFVIVKDGEYAGGVMIDPKAFETFAVTRVPTIILAETQLATCLDAACLREVPKHDRLMGSVSLEYALKLFAREGDMKTAAAEKLKAVSKSIYSAYEE